MNRKIFIGVAWPYVNGNLHIGHLAGYLLPADISARFHRYLGDDVLMVSGSDCFGTPITVEAEKKGVKPQELVDEYYPQHVELFKKIGISFDLFTKTTAKNHKEIVQDFFLKFLNQGYIYKDTVEQYYDSKNERFLPDRYVEGECPHCGFREARSDQCDNCGRVLDEGELKNPVSKLTDEPVKFKETEHYFLDLEKLQPFIDKYFKDASGNWRSWVREETRGWLDRGLKPRAFTRDLEWGVPLPVDKIPEDKRIKRIEHKSIYVWWEAVIGYFSASVEWAKENNKDWKDFWHDKDSLHYYFMGKDNLPYHTMFWPGELHLYDKKLHLPDKPVINQYLNFGSKQFSKSRGVIVNSGYITEKYGVDAVRFYLTLVMPENADTSFGWSDFRERHNSITIGNLGNFFNRTLKMSQEVSVNIDALEDEVIDKVKTNSEKAKKLLLENKYRDYAQTILDLSNFGNKYLSDNKPWKKEGKEKEGILTNGLFVCLGLQAIIKPLLIKSVEKLENITNVSFDRWPDDVEVIKNKLQNIKITNPEGLFDKIDEEAIEKEVSKRD